MVVAWLTAYIKIGRDVYVCGFHCCFCYTTNTTRSGHNEKNMVELISVPNPPILCCEDSITDCFVSFLVSDTVFTFLREKHSMLLWCF